MSTDSSIQASDDDHEKDKKASKKEESDEELPQIEKTGNKEDSKDYSKAYINVPKLLIKNKPLNTTYTPQPPKNFSMLNMKRQGFGQNKYSQRQQQQDYDNKLKMFEAKRKQQDRREQQDVRAQHLKSLQQHQQRQQQQFNKQQQFEQQQTSQQKQQYRPEQYNLATTNQKQQYQFQEHSGKPVTIQYVNRQLDHLSSKLRFQFPLFKDIPTPCYDNILNRKQGEAYCNKYGGQQSYRSQQSNRSTFRPEKYQKYSPDAVQKYIDEKYPEMSPRSRSKKTHPRQPRQDNRETQYGNYARKAQEAVEEIEKFKQKQRNNPIHKPYKPYSSRYSSQQLQQNSPIDNLAFNQQTYQNQFDRKQQQQPQNYMSGFKFYPVDQDSSKLKKDTKRNIPEFRGNIRDLFRQNQNQMFYENDYLKKSERRQKKERLKQQEKDNRLQESEAQIIELKKQLLEQQQKIKFYHEKFGNEEDEDFQKNEEEENPIINENIKF